MLANKTTYGTKGKIYTYYTFIGILLLFTFLALSKELYLLAVVPIALLALVTILVDYRILYYGFWVLLPFSIEFSFGSIGIDLPTEPMMLGLTGISIILFITKIKEASFKYIYHPISVLLLLHLIWLLFTTLYSQSIIVSLKFFLAKLWFVIPFFFMSFHMIRSEKDIEKIVRILSIFLSIAVSIVLVRHALDGFTFKGSHFVVRPIFRNHVNYSAIIVVVLPFIWALYHNSINRCYRTLSNRNLFFLHSCWTAKCFYCDRGILYF